MRTKQTARTSTTMPVNDHVCGLYFKTDHKRFYLPQVELKSHTTINPVCFTTKLTQTFDDSNDVALPQVRYTFPLYDGVAVNGYSISYGEKVIHGIVQQKAEAKKTYQAAIHRGETAGLLESLPAGVFGVTLGNVPAKTAITVDITYCGELKHDAAIDGLRYTLPTSIAPRYGSHPGEVLKSNATAQGGISITVDVDMAGSAIRKVQSPSHPIALSMGALSTTEGGDKAPFAPSQASATLTQGSAELADDFILQLLVDDISRPQAILETHPTLPNQRALMTTLVPKFTLESANPEIVFIADQSGSMSGTKNASLVKALKVFLKSLPFGVRFNICAFGSDFKFLFPKSQAYNEDNLNTALSFVESFRADYGGTKILEPITAAFEQHLSDLSLEVMLLTDGEIWGETSVFNYINEQVVDKKIDARVFALGIGRDVSHTLVEGVARAGNGFAQFVTLDEETDQKVMRMLKGALFAHTKDHELEVHYDDRDEKEIGDEDEFEIVEKVDECLKIDDQLEVAAGDGKEGSGRAKAISFFDTSAGLDKDTKSVEGANRYAHLPAIETPKLLQAPSTIPPLFPFNRTTLYILLGPETTQKKLISVTLRATSPQGPLELNIPVYTPTPTDVPTIHQLATRKATQDLEEGRGWLHSATIGGVAAKTKFDSRFDELVERECVRLGEKFQVAGKWTSFVAVKASGKEDEDVQGFPEAPTRRQGFAAMAPRKQLASKAARRCVKYDDDDEEEDDDSPDAAPPLARSGRQAMLFGSANASLHTHSASIFGAAPSSSGSLFGAAPSSSGGLFGGPATRLQPSSQPSQKSSALLTTSSNSNRSAPSTSTSPRSGFCAKIPKSRAAPPPPPSRVSAFGAPPAASPSCAPPQPTAASYGYAEGYRESKSVASPHDNDALADPVAEDEDGDEDMGFALWDDGAPTAPQYSFATQKSKAMPLADEEDARIAALQVSPAVSHARMSASGSAEKMKSTMGSVASSVLPARDTRGSAGDGDGSTSAEDEDTRKMSALIDLQTFSGAWGWSLQLLSLLSVTEADVKATGLLGSEGDDDDETIMATVLVIAFLEKRVKGKKEVWEMVVSKARAWLGKAWEKSGSGSEAKVEEVVGKAKELF